MLALSTPKLNAVSKTGRIMALDGLRGVAAILVLLHHALLMFPDFANFEWGVPGAIAHGPVEWLLLRTPVRLIWAGQERAILFFVLSGFVLSLPWINRKAATYGAFLCGRLCRIYPPYLIAMSFAAMGSVVLGGHPLLHASIYFNQLGWAFPPSWTAVPSILLVINDYSSQFMDEAVWSLVWELRVAVIFPLLILGVIRWRGAGIVAVMAGLILLEYLGNRWIGPTASKVLNRPQDTFNFAQYFILGAAIALYRPLIEAWFERHRSSYGLICLAIGCLVCWAPWPYAHNRIVGIGATIIIVAIIGSPCIRAWLTSKSLLWLGKRSYSLYLIHVPLVMVVIVSFGGTVPVWACVAILPITIGVTALFYRWMETPSVALAQRWTAAASTGRVKALSTSTTLTT